MKKALFLAAAFSTASFPVMAQERPLFTYEGYVVTLPAGDAWCDTIASVNVAAPATLGFDGQEDKLSRMIGGLRSILPAECPGAESILLTGFVDGKKTYEGIASEDTKWVLSEILPPTPEEMKLLADLEVIGQCDELASHPDDPEAMADGVKDEALNGEAIVASCSKAVAIESDTPRLKFQLGRGYWQQGRIDEATDQFLAAAETEHGASLAYLGDIYLHGMGDVDADPAQAQIFYQKAAEAGFELAKTVLASFEDKTEELAKAEAEENAPEPTYAQGSGTPYNCQILNTWATATGEETANEWIEISILIDEKDQTITFTDGSVPSYSEKPLFIFNKKYPYQKYSDRIVAKAEPLGATADQRDISFYPEKNILHYWQFFSSGSSLFGFDIFVNLFGKGECYG